MKKIAIFGVPRSGTSWISQIFNSHPCVAVRFQPLFSHGHKGRINENTTSEDLESFFQEILCSNDPFVLMKSELHKNYPTFLKKKPTHIAFKETRYLNLIEIFLKSSLDICVFGILRNPHSVIASWARAPKEFDPTWSLAEEWLYAKKKNQNKEEEFYGLAKWIEVTKKFLSYEEEYPQNFKIINYDSLCFSPEEKTSNFFEFAELNMDGQVVDFLKQSSSRHDSNDPYSVFRGKANSEGWKEVLPTELARRISLEVKSAGLERFLIG